MGRALDIEAWARLPEGTPGELAHRAVSLPAPALGSVEIFELESGRFARAAAATSGTLAEVPGCPGLALDLDQLWAELARLDANE